MTTNSALHTSDQMVNRVVDGTSALSKGTAQLTIWSDM